MEKKILVAVDDSRQSNLMLDYLAGVYPEIFDLTFLFANVHPQISSYISQEARINSRARLELDRVVACHKNNSRALLEKARERLMENTHPDTLVDLISLPFSGSISTTILKAALDHQVDAMVTGRRGLSKLMELYSGSVSGDLIQDSKVIPVWAVGGRAENRKLMVPVDGSRHSLTALDHLTFMFQGNADIIITLFHVRPRLRDFCEIDFTETQAGAPLETVLLNENDACIKGFYSHALRLFKETGFKDDQVVIKTVDSLTGIDSMIVSEAEAGGYDTIVMGRRGRKDGLFTGSVTRQVLKKITDRAVWIIP